MPLPMEPTRHCFRLSFLVASVIFFTRSSDARNLMQFLDVHRPGEGSSHTNIYPKSDYSKAEFYGQSQFESIAPLPSLDNSYYYYNAPYCVYPPFNPQPPFTSPNLPSQNLPPHTPAMGPRPSTISPGPNPPVYILRPPGGIPLSPINGPSQPNHAPGPPVYLPPVVFPPPTGPAPPHKGPRSATWCVAKPSVPDPIIQEAMDYACATGADCESIQPNGPCFQPNSLLSHASYAFNSYWQNSKAAGGTCDFGGTAMLVTIDPSFEDCKYVYH